MDSVLIAKVRNLINDNIVEQDPIDFTYYTSKIFNLPDKNIDENTLVVEKNGAEWDDSNFTYDGKLRINENTGEELISGDILRIRYSCYEKYSDNEIIANIKNTLYYLSFFNYKTFTLGTGDLINPEPTEQQENIIAIVASILIKGSIRSYKTPEFTVQFNDNLSIEDKIKKIIEDFGKSFGNLVFIDPTLSSSEVD